MLKRVLSYFIFALVLLSSYMNVWGEIDINDFDYQEVYKDDETDEFAEFSKYWGDYEYAKRKRQNYEYTYSYDVDSENLLIYDLSVPSFEKFVESPCGDTLKELFDMPLNEATVLEASLYVENNKKYGKVLKEETINPVLINDKYYTVYGIDRTFEWDYVFIKIPLINILSVDSTQRYLNENGINDKVIDRVLMHTLYYPFVLWVKTDSDTYFIRLDIVFNREKRKTEFIRKIYTLDEFQSEFVEKNGKLIIDGQEMPDGNVTFYKDYPLIKARVIWEYLSGREVIWHPEDMSVSFWLKGAKMDFKKEIHGINDFYYFYKNNDEEPLYEFKPTLMNGAFYWYPDELKSYLESNYNRKLTIDTENKRVIIEKIEK